MAVRIDEDDFFGDDGEATDRDHRCLIDIDGSQSHSGLQAADSKAEQERFRTLGYHETYDTSKEERLQAGFQDGYLSTYEDAHRIGELMGRVIMKSKVDSSPAKQEDSREGHKTSSPVARSIAQVVRAFVVVPENHGQLPRLETQVTKLLLEASTQNKSGDSEAYRLT